MINLVVKLVCHAVKSKYINRDYQFFGTRITRSKKTDTNRHVTCFLKSYSSFTVSESIIRLNYLHADWGIKL